MGCSASSSAQAKVNDPATQPAAITAAKKRTKRAGRRSKARDDVVEGTTLVQRREVHAGARAEFSQISGAQEENLVAQWRRSAKGHSLDEAPHDENADANPNLNPFHPPAAPSQSDSKKTRVTVSAFLRFQQREREGTILDTSETDPQQSAVAERGNSWRVHNVNLLQPVNQGIAALAAYLSEPSANAKVCNDQRQSVLSSSKLRKIQRWIDCGVHRDLLDPQDVQGQQVRESREIASNDEGVTIALAASSSSRSILEPSSSDSLCSLLISSRATPCGAVLRPPIISPSSPLSKSLPANAAGNTNFELPTCISPKKLRASSETEETFV